MRGWEDIPRQRYAKEVCNLEADFMATHTNTGGGAWGQLILPTSAGHATFRLLDQLEMPASSKQDRAFLGLCNLRPLTRCYDPEPLGGLWPATILKTLARGAMVKWAALATVGGPKSTPARHHRGCGQFHMSYDSCSDGGCQPSACCLTGVLSVARALGHIFLTKNIFL